MVVVESGMSDLFVRTTIIEGFGARRGVTVTVAEACSCERWAVGSEVSGALKKLGVLAKL